MRHYPDFPEKHRPTLDPEDDEGKGWPPGIWPKGEHQC